MKIKTWFPVLLFAVIFVPELAYAQDSTSTINVYLDCRRACNERFVKDQIKYVNYVRNIEDSDVHLLITRDRVNSGGDRYTLQFIGENKFIGVDRTREYFKAESDTEDEARIGLNNTIKIGLFPYLEDLPVSEQLIISYEQKDETVDVQEDTDKWNFWVFDLNASTGLEGERSEKELSLNGRFSAERVTKEWKFELEMDQYYDRQTFKDDSTTNVFTRLSRGADVALVKSLGDHWAVGVTSRASQSSRSNYDLLLEGSPAVEYSIFPYEEFTKREVTLRYRLTYGYYDYTELTVYGKNTEQLMKQQFRANFEFTQPWGEFEARVEGSAYLHDFTKNRLDTRVEWDFRIFRGLSIYVSGRYSWINNQLSIPAGGVTEQERLLNLREVSTSYSYDLRFGMSFTFGSIYNNIINPRL